MSKSKHIFLMLWSGLILISICHANPTVELVPNNLTTELGNTFNLDLDVKNVPSGDGEKCEGFEAEIDYNNSLLNLTSIQLSDIGNTANLKSVDVDDGRISLVWFSNSPSGNFTLATVSFKSISSGIGTISLRHVVISNELGYKYDNLTVNGANITVNSLNQTIGKILLNNFAYNKDIDAIIHIDGAKSPIYNISGNITFNNVNINGNPVVLLPFNTSVMTASSPNTLGFYLVPKNSSEYMDVLKIPINIPNPYYNISLNLLINGKPVKTYIEIPTTNNVSEYSGFITDDSFGNVVENTNITFGTSKTIELKAFNIKENITKIVGFVYINTSMFEVKNYKIPDFSKICDKINYSNISLNNSYLFFNISLLNSTNDSFSIVEFNLYPLINKNISSNIYVSNFTLYSNETPITIPSKSISVQIIGRNNNTAPTGKIALSIRNNNEVDFYALGYDPDDEELKYYWDFGDGTNSTMQNPTHTYKNYTNYLVKLKVEDSLNTTYTTCCVVPLNKYEPLNYSFSRINFTDQEINKTTVLTLYVKNPLHWKVRAYINFEDYGGINITKPQYSFELNPNETKLLKIPLSIEKTCHVKWNLIYYPMIKYKNGSDAQFSYYLWDYNKKIEVSPSNYVKINEFKKYISLNSSDVILNINKNKIFKKYVINKTVKLDLVEKRTVFYYCIISLIGFMIGMVFTKAIIVVLR